MAFWNRRKEQREDELRRAEAKARDVMAREPTTGPHARPWKQRRTTKPYPEYQAVMWDQWSFVDVDSHATHFAVPEHLIGAVFPGDSLRINNEWRKVVKVHLSFRRPILEFESSKSAPELPPRSEVLAWAEPFEILIEDDPDRLYVTTEDLSEDDLYTIDRGDGFYLDCGDGSYDEVYEYRILRQKDEVYPGEFIFVLEPLDQEAIDRWWQGH
jgi:hypothetical protein